MNYTKSPWEMSELYHDFNIGDHRLIRGADGRLVCHVWPDSNSQTDANARLITEAPAMYEEWEDVLCVAQSNQDKTGEWWRDWLTHKAKKILAKVEGK